MLQIKNKSWSTSRKASTERRKTKKNIFCVFNLTDLHLG